MAHKTEITNQARTWAAAMRLRPQLLGRGWRTVTLPDGTKVGAVNRPELVPALVAAITVRPAA
jgi:hypothetical protein